MVICRISAYLHNTVVDVVLILTSARVSEFFG